jgi:hypothetical protein
MIMKKTIYLLLKVLFVGFPPAAILMKKFRMAERIAIVEAPENVESW